MKSIIVKYLAYVWTLGIIAANFIACGSQMYQVSVQEDFDHRSAAQANPEMENPESHLYGIHATDGWKKLPITYRFDKRLNVEQRSHLYAAMRIWEVAIGKKLFSTKGLHGEVTGDSFKDLYSSLDDGVNGHYLDDDWAKTQKPDQVLATTIWNTSADAKSITTADIRFNNHGYIIGDSLVQQATETKEVVDMQTLALHELGHLLGLGHVDAEVDPYSIMNPTLYIGEGLTSRDLSDGDIVRIQTIYGCEGDACEAQNVREQLKAMQQQTNLVDPLTIAH